MPEARRIELPKAAKIAILCAAALLIAVMAFLVVSRILGKSDVREKHIAVYRANGETYIDINGRKTSCNGLETGSFVINESSQRVFFTAVSSYDSALYDIYYCEINSMGEITAPMLIDYGVEGGYTVSEDGKKIYYLKYGEASETVEADICEVSSKKKTMISSNVEAIYVFPVSQEVYYTKMHSTNRVLYKYSGGKSQEQCRGIRSAAIYADCAKPHLIYQAEAQSSALLSELYIAFSDSEPKLIADGVFSVMLDSYSPGGNLYYFKAAQQGVSWTSVIADEYREADSSLSKPVRSDFFSFFGFSYDYYKALAAYNDKLKRDEIRTALDAAFATGDLLAPVFCAYAYNDGGVVELADDINPDKVCCVCAFGEPKIIFESTKTVEGKTDMSELLAIAERGDINAVIDYACDEIKASTVSGGMALSANPSGSPVEYSLAGYDKNKTQFKFENDGSGFFAFVKDEGNRFTVYANELSGAGPRGAQSVDTNVSGYAFTEDRMYYLKLDSGRIYGDLFAYQNGEKTKVFNAANAFLIKGENGDKIIVLKNYNSAGAEPVADYYTFVGGEEILVDSGVVISAFSADSSGRMAYLVLTDGGKKEMRMFENGVRITVAQDVSEIVTFR